MPINSIRNKCDFLIAIDVSAIPEVTPKELTNTLEVFTRSLRLTMKQQRSVNLNEVDLFICPKKLQFQYFRNEFIRKNV